MPGGHALMLLDGTIRNGGKAIIANYYETTGNNIHFFNTDYFNRINVVFLILSLLAISKDSDIY